MEREIRELRERMDAMETTQWRDPDFGDIGDAENEDVIVEDYMEELLLKAVVRLGSRQKINIPMYQGNLDTEELIYWI